MNLKRIADEVQTQINDDVLAALDGKEPFDDYELEFARVIPIDALNDALSSFSGQQLQPAVDAAMATAIHGSLPLTAREATDRNLWWWLTLRRYPHIVMSRWGRPGAAVTRERVLGPVNRNAFARLWWGAEMTRSTSDPAKYTRLMFKNQDLFEAIIGRSLGRNPEALQAVLDELSDMSGRDARETVRDFRYLLSTLVLEAMSPDEVRSELNALKALR